MHIFSSSLKVFHKKTLCLRANWQVCTKFATTHDHHCVYKDLSLKDSMINILVMIFFSDLIHFTDYPMCLVPAQLKTFFFNLLKKCTEPTLKLIYQRSVENMVQELSKGAVTCCKQTCTYSHMH